MSALEVLSHLWTARALMAAVNLGVADRIGETARSAPELAAELALDPEALYRLLRGLSAAGFFRELPDRRFLHTAASAELRSGQDAALHLRVFALRPFLESWLNFDEALSREKRLDKPRGSADDFWSALFADARATAAYQDSMSALCRRQIPALLERLNLDGVASVADLGGGHGLLLAALLEKYPRLQGELLDFPAVAEGARAALGPWINQGRARVKSGDLRRTLPEGHDAYIVKNILHGLPDHDARELLMRLREQLNAPAKRLLIVETLMPETEAPHPAKRMDLFLLSGGGGSRLRTEAELRGLLNSAGFSAVHGFDCVFHPSIRAGGPDIMELRRRE